MKKALLLGCILLFLNACTKSPQKVVPIKVVPIIEWTDKIVTQYPNCHSNELIEKIVMDSASNYSKRFIGNEATILEGVDFKFVRIVENKDSFAVFFDAQNCYSDIEYKQGDNKYIRTDIIIRVLGKVDKTTASKLSEDKSYNISGTVHEWDKEDRFFISSSSFDKIDFGTFILNKDIEIKEVKDEQ